MNRRNWAITLVAMALVACANEAQAPADDERSIAVSRGPLVQLNALEAVGRIVFYDRREVIDDIRGGRLVASDDPREIWRFSLPRNMLDVNADETIVDLSVPDVEVVVHLGDPGCPPEADCPMVTLTRGADARFFVDGRGRLVRDQGVLRFYFEAEALFEMENGVRSTMTYRGGAYQP